MEIKRSNEQSVISIRGWEVKQETARSLFELACLWAAGVPRGERRKMEFGHEVISDGYACIFIYPPPVTDPRTICANREAGLANKPNGRRPFPQDRRMIVSRPFWYIHDRLEYRPMLLPPAFIISNPLEPSVNRDREVDCAVAIDLVSSCFGFSGNGNLRGS